jgi:hypothetical protein
MADRMELDSVEINSESSEKTEELSEAEWAAIEAAEKEAIETFKDEKSNNNNTNKRHPATLDEDQKKMSLVFDLEEEDTFFKVEDNRNDTGVRTRTAASAQSGKNFLFYSGKKMTVSDLINFLTINSYNNAMNIICII